MVWVSHINSLMPSLISHIYPSFITICYLVIIGNYARNNYFMDCMSQSIRILISLVFARLCSILFQGVMSRHVIQFPHFHNTQTVPTHSLVSQLHVPACGRFFHSLLKRYLQLKQLQSRAFSD